MKYLLLSLSLFISVYGFTQKSLTSSVNPFIGTDGPGNTYPGATAPYGMVQLSPDIGTPGWDRIAGYFYQDSIISGFSHTHLTGTGAGDLYDILVMPVNSKSSKRIEANGYRPFSAFNHQQESASAGYYQVELTDYEINVELTATPRVGIQRYTFPKDSASQVYVDLGYALNWDRATDTYIKVVNNTTLEGYRKSTGWAKDERIYFVMQFSKPFKSYTLFEGKNKVDQEATGVNTKIILNYATAEAEQLVVKTALSTANIKGAYASMNTEASHFEFDAYRKQTEAVWEDQLSKIKITTEDQDQKALFYTMMYQSMLAPTLLSDPKGAYKGADNEVNTAQGFDRFDTFSLWDTFRAAHPLYTIIQQERLPDFVQSLLAHYKETGLLPVWSMQGNETNMMLGYHAVPVVVDAYFKGFDFDAELAYEACKASATAADRSIPIYSKLGYVPATEENEDWSVSKTLEYAYDDWCIAQFAKALGKKEDYKYFSKRAENWKKLHDNKTNFFRPKTVENKFVEPFVAKEYTRFYSESNAWQYYWFVPQDIQGLIKKTGGSTAFEQKLDSMFSLYPKPTDKLPIFSTGMIGQYNHGNEPSHHVAYLYNYVGKPSKAQERIREILKTQYKNEPYGHCGNEDCGQMSSWYVFSALGFYPVNPAQGAYILGIPLFERAEIKLPGNKKFIISAQNFSDKNTYVKRIFLNGKPLKRGFITHSEITNGGELLFEMTADATDQRLEIPKPDQVYK
ncbi:GH92 family glycosyl hydrolase [Leeuwenhoekiella palythoae]|uniref:Alpha-1,2-mannosidase n=1 Tax=Leeuwenhoekiella palythoae TaxID=573501 RepID=A0A1M5X1G9_9FLAO|nr:GH92 family glycosyl hydrolase [Leeuwenhoekiella palythoae]RXG31611.1 putative alpha-1,2-mannosidase [Leeuwenhoekiella palythoae]SHH93033.1 alpha-1,2-mannosidase, putative [Leeuwenhoekiella palythoae]